MRKKMIVLTLVVVMVVASTAPALAAGRSRTNELPGRQFFTLVGIVHAENIDPAGSGNVTVTVYHGNRFAKPHFGTELTVQVTAVGTEYRRWTPAGCVPTIPDNVNVGDTISIHGMVDGGVFHGERVTVDVPLLCCSW